MNVADEYHARLTYKTLLLRYRLGPSHRRGAWAVLGLFISDFLAIKGTYCLRFIAYNVRFNLLTTPAPLSPAPPLKKKMEGAKM